MIFLFATLDMLRAWHDDKSLPRSMTASSPTQPTNLTNLTQRAHHAQASRPTTNTHPKPDPKSNMPCFPSHAHAHAHSRAGPGGGHRCGEGVAGHGVRELLRAPALRHRRRPLARHRQGPAQGVCACVPAEANKAQANTEQRSPTQPNTAQPNKTPSRSHGSMLTASYG
jgi:hypothetical protein